MDDRALWTCCFVMSSERQTSGRIVIDGGKRLFAFLLIENNDDSTHSTRISNDCKKRIYFFVHTTGDVYSK